MNMTETPATVGAIHAGYMPGFGNEFETEALAGALPIGRNSPQRCPYGLYAEQLSGSPFTAPRRSNERSWLYRIRPTVQHIARMEPVDLPLWRSAPVVGETPMPPLPMRWGPVPYPDAPQTFVDGMRTICAAGDVHTHAGSATHIYHATISMEDDYFYNADGEMLVVPQEGSLTFATEMGVIAIAPGEIAILPRGLKYKVGINGPARGYVLENYGAKFTCPERGPIGANCLANPRDFLTPVAAYEDRDGARCRLTIKWGGAFHRCEIDHSPLDVVAWHGNYAPYKYDLRRFSPVGPILFDHADPSIFTVLTAPSGEPGTANVDFVIFPPRWLVGEDTFRPPWYHRNLMSELMGLVTGVYDAKAEGFVPGGASLHSRMSAHGPDAETTEHAENAELKPHKLDGTMAFMFETHAVFRVSAHKDVEATGQADYDSCWNGITARFGKS